ncbi:MAG: DUF2096 family protein [Candidatus Bathyarchaeia archaeon]|nr:DUF2096 family protein [Candidatus Bathyarchaeota archaeon]
MSWERRWRVLSDVITDLFRAGEMIPPNIINDLRSAKVILEILKIDRERPENVSRIEECLSNVEAYVLSAAEKRFGEKYVEGVLRQLCMPGAEEVEGGERVGFRPGLPREERWVRVKITDETPLEIIRGLADESGLKIRVECDGYVLVYGGEKELKDFIRRMAEKMGSR